MKIYNFGSRYPGWADDITELVGGLQDRAHWEAGIPTIPAECLLARMEDLRYYALIDRLSLKKRIDIFRCLEDNNE